MIFKLSLIMVTLTTIGQCHSTTTFGGEDGEPEVASKSFFQAKFILPTKNNNYRTTRCLQKGLFAYTIVPILSKVSGFNTQLHFYSYLDHL